MDRRAVYENVLTSRNSKLYEDKWNEDYRNVWGS